MRMCCAFVPLQNRRHQPAVNDGLNPVARVHAGVKQIRLWTAFLWLLIVLPPATAQMQSMSAG